MRRRHLLPATILALTACQGGGGGEEPVVGTDFEEPAQSTDPAEDESTMPPEEVAAVVCAGDAGYRARTPTCGGLSDAWTKASVNVGWYPYRAVRRTPILMAEGEVLGWLDAGDTFSLQSTRNPRCLDAPPLRPARDVDGALHRWGYAADGSTTGWVADADLVWDAADAGRVCQDGPARVDFMVSHDPQRSCEPTACRADPGRERGMCWSSAVNSQYDGDRDCGGERLSLSRRVDARESHLRFAPLSTSHHYVFRDDQVHVMYRAHGWSFVEVTASRHPQLTPVGTRGWLQDTSLE
jgi:hypothetical protein